MYLLMMVLVLHCFWGFSLVVVRGAYSLVVVSGAYSLVVLCRLLIAGASLAEHGL